MAVTYDLPMEHAPQLAMIGIGRHGSLALEKFLIPEAWCLHLYRDAMRCNCALASSGWMCAPVAPR